jgi:two-component system, chemotaxis family, chemotaxis protein CheY
MTRLSRSALIVIDSAPLRRYSASSLEGAGFDCIEAANGFLAMDRLSERPFDLYVIDVDMPAPDGLAIFTITLFGGYRDPSPVVIGLSARLEAEARTGPWGDEAEFAAVIPKPFPPHVLIDAARAAIAGKTDAGRP